MRILHISALPVWSMDGKGGMPSLHETLKGHARAGHELCLVLPQYNLQAPKPEHTCVPPGQPWEVVFAPCRWVPALLEVRRLASRLGGGHGPPYPLRWLLNLAMMLLLTGSLLAVALRLRYRLRKRFDLVYAHNQYAAMAGWLIACILRVPNVTRLYGTFLADLMRRPLVWLRYPVSAAGYLVPHDLLICANDGTRGDEVARRLGIDLARFRFWQNGVDRPVSLPGDSRHAVADKAPANLRCNSRWIISCSRLANWKRVDRIIRALRICRCKGCDAQLLIVGDGPEADRLKSLAAEQGVARDVVWFGTVAHREVWRLMGLSDVFVIANDVTNRCNPLYEAICMGLPVVSVFDPSTQDLLKDGENALLADREDETRLGEQMYRACTDAELAAGMREAQRQRADTFWTWEARMEVEAAELARLVRHRHTAAGSKSPGRDTRQPARGVQEPGVRRPGYRNHAS